MVNYRSMARTMTMAQAKKLKTEIDAWKADEFIDNARPRRIAAVMCEITHDARARGFPFGTAFLLILQAWKEDTRENERNRTLALFEIKNILGRWSRELKDVGDGAHCLAVEIRELV